MDLLTQCKTIEEIIGSLKPKDLSFKKNAETWSILEILEHLVMVEIGIAKMIGNNKGSAQEKTNLQNTEKLKMFTKNREKKYQAPTTIQPTGMIKDATKAIEMLASNRQRLTEAITDDKIDWMTEAPPHPFAGSMSKRDWLDFMPAHMDRHIDQIKEVIGKLNKTV
jgi:uncharacterized damage-inducible protein DinB